MTRAKAVAGRRRRLCSAAARRENSPDLAKSGRPGVKSTRSWVGWTPRSMRDPLGRFPGFGGLCRGSPWRRAALARRRAASSASKGYGLPNLAPKGPGRVVGSHRGFWWPETSRRWVVGEARRRGRCGGRGAVVGVQFRSPWSRGSSCERAVKPAGRSGG